MNDTNPTQEGEKQPLTAGELMRAKQQLEQRVAQERKRKEAIVNKNVQDRETLITERVSLKDLIEQAEQTKSYYDEVREVGELPEGFEQQYAEVAETLKKLQEQEEEMAKKIDSLTAIPEVQKKLVEKAHGHFATWEEKRKRDEYEQLEREFQKGDLGRIKVELEAFVTEDQRRAQEIRSKRHRLSEAIKENASILGFTRELRGKKKDKIHDPDRILNTNYARGQSNSRQEMTDIKQAVDHYESELGKLGIARFGRKDLVRGLIDLLKPMIKQEQQVNEMVTDYNAWRQKELKAIHLGAFTRGAARISEVGARLSELHPGQYGSGIDGKKFFISRMQSGSYWNQIQTTVNKDAFGQAFHEMATLQIEEEES